MVLEKEKRGKEMKRVDKNKIHTIGARKPTQPGHRVGGHILHKAKSTLGPEIRMTWGRMDEREKSVPKVMMKRNKNEI